MDSKIKRKHVTADPDEPNDLISSSQTDLYADVIPNLHPRSSRRTLLKTGLDLAVVATGAGTWLGLHREVTSAKQQTDNVVIQWNSAALQAIGNTATGPTIGARALAITHTSMYDAWSVYDATAVATRPNGIPRQKSKWKDETEAVCYAAYRALMDLFPFISLKNKHDINADIKMFFALTNVIFDASIACWDCKRAYDSARPVTAVHYLYSGQNVSAWAGPGKGTQLISGGSWRSYLPTPAGR